MRSNENDAASLMRRQFLKVSEVAKLLKVKTRTIYGMVAEERIDYRKLPSSNILRFDLDEIIAWTRGKHNEPKRVLKGLAST